MRPSHLLILLFSPALSFILPPLPPPTFPHLLSFSSSPSTSLSSLFSRLPHPSFARTLPSSSSSLSAKPELNKNKWEDVDRTLLSDSSGGKGITDGDVPVTFTQGNVTKTTMAIKGQPLSEVASQADQFIKYKCGKGECGTCEVLIDGQWVRSCVTKVPSDLGPGKGYTVSVRESMVPASKKAAGFFSFESVTAGFQNNVLGMVGLVDSGSKEEDNFKHRIGGEDDIKELVRKKKEARLAAEASKKK